MRLNFSSEGNPLDGAVFERSAFSNGRQQFGLRSESFFDNEPKQMLSAVPDKNKQTVAPPISGCFVVVAVQFVSILAQSTFPYSSGLHLCCCPKRLNTEVQVTSARCHYCAKKIM